MRALTFALLCLTSSAQAADIAAQAAAQAPADPLVTASLQMQAHQTQYQEQRARADVIFQTAWLLRGKQFEALNAMAERYRKNGETTPSGEPLLAYFYEGLKTNAYQQIAAMPDKPVDVQWQPQIDTIKEWIAKAPSPAAHIALAKFYNNWAAAWRGSGYAKDVPQTAWAPYYAKLAESRKVLMDSKKIASIDPEWYRAVIALARQQDTDPKITSALIEEAVEKNKYYDRIYLGIADAMQPKWGGSWEALDSFAHFAVENTADKDGKTLYARIYIEAENCDCSLFTDSKVDWPLLKASFGELVKRHPSQWNIGTFAYFACMAEDKDVARKQLLLMTEFSADAWSNRVDYYGECRKWAAEA